MNRSGIVTIFGVLLVSCVQLRAAEDQPAADVPELKVLQHYHGTWDVELKDERLQGGESTARWVLGGRFLEQSGVVKQQDGTAIHVTTLYTYDVPRKAYRSWTFVSTGTVSEAEMRWDAERKIMTSTMQARDDGIRTTITADFSTSGKERWRMVFTDRDGQQVGELQGENTRRENPADSK